MDVPAPSGLNTHTHPLTSLSLCHRHHDKPTCTSHNIVHRNYRAIHQIQIWERVSSPKAYEGGHIEKQNNWLGIESSARWEPMYWIKTKLSEYLFKHTILALSVTFYFDTLCLLNNPSPNLSQGSKSLVKEDGVGIHEEQKWEAERAESGRRSFCLS